MVVSIAIIVIGTELCALALVYLRNYRAAHPNSYHKAPIAGDIFGVIGTGFAVILAFVIFTAFESYQKARDDTGIESVATRQLYALADFYPAQNRDILQSDLVCYGRAVINDEWPLMATGDDSTLVDSWVERLDNDMLATPIQTVKEIEVFNTWFARSGERAEGRRGRLAESLPYVPPFVWAMIVLLFVVVVGYQVIFVRPTRPLFPQLIGVSAVASTLLAGIVLVNVLDAPFADRGAMLSPFRMQSTLQVMEAELTPGVTIPCDAFGNPTK